MNRKGPEPDPPQSYIIDVCLTCGKHAKWPFCVHRSETERWTFPLAVKPTAASHRVLLECMRTHAQYADMRGRS